MDASRPLAGDTSSQSPPREADLPVLDAVRELFSGLRAGASDIADLVAAEAHVALNLLVGIVVSAVGAAMLGIFAVAGILVTIATALVERGASLTTAIVVVIFVCAAGSVIMTLKLRAIARRVLFARSRTHLRGGM